MWSILRIWARGHKAGQSSHDVGVLGLALQCRAIGFDGGGSSCVSRISGIELGELGWLLGQCCILKALYLGNDGRKRLPAHLPNVISDFSHQVSSLIV